MNQTIPSPKGELEVALGAQFRETRRSREIWLRDLSKRLGVSVNTLRWHEAGARMMRVDQLVKAAAIIGVRPIELIELTAWSDIPSVRSTANDIDAEETEDEQPENP